MRLCALLLVAASLLPACRLTAQEPTEEPSRGPDAGTEYRVHGIQVLPAVGRPFSALDNIVWTRNLEDGSKVTTYLYATVARDSQGRIYRHRAFVPPTRIKNPSAGTSCFWIPSLTRALPARLRSVIALSPAITNRLRLCRRRMVYSRRAPAIFPARTWVPTWLMILASSARVRRFPLVSARLATPSRWLPHESSGIPLTFKLICPSPATTQG